MHVCPSLLLRSDAMIWPILSPADGNEGGRHQMIKATVSDGQLWILLARAGDKRWFKGAKKDLVGIVDSFIVSVFL